MEVVMSSSSSTLKVDMFFHDRRSSSCPVLAREAMWVIGTEKKNRGCWAFMILNKMEYYQKRKEKDYKERRKTSSAYLFPM